MGYDIFIAFNAEISEGRERLVSGMLCIDAHLFKIEEYLFYDTVNQ
jgi:hypothetical protein